MGDEVERNWGTEPQMDGQGKAAPRKPYRARGYTSDGGGGVGVAVILLILIFKAKNRPKASVLELGERRGI